LFKNKKFRVKRRFDEPQHEQETHLTEEEEGRRLHANNEHANELNAWDRYYTLDTSACFLTILLSPYGKDNSLGSNKYLVGNSGNSYKYSNTLWPAEITMIKPQARKEIFDIGRAGPLSGCI
jgi:hypothetical protein